MSEKSNVAQDGPSFIQTQWQRLCNSIKAVRYQQLPDADEVESRNGSSVSTSINRYDVVYHLQKRTLLVAINVIACLAIFFFGYDQGVMGGVNIAEDYYHKTMHYGYKDAKSGAMVVTNAWLQGGIVAVYYLGTLVGCLFGGSYGDKNGRIKTIKFGALCAIIGAIFQTSAQGPTWMILARFVNGIGTGMLNAIVPVWASETAEHTSRGQFIAVEFTLNIFGVAAAYWIGYICSLVSDPTSQLVWRIPIGVQLLPLIILFVAVGFFPESPRWLAKVGREIEARFILGRLRGEAGLDEGKAEAEFQGILNEVASEMNAFQSQNYWNMFFGIGSGQLHIGRRVHLVIWLQIVQEWLGIASITIYQPTIFAIAGISNKDSGWISGLNITFYMLFTLVCVFTIDKIGRRWTLYWGSTVMGICMLLAGLFSHSAIEHSKDGVKGYGIAAVSCVFLFTATFGATWLTVPWLYPAEIFPLEIRAMGNAWGVVGWSIGNMMLTALCPWLFETIHEKTLYIFAACNLVSIPMVWALYPETNQLTLEEINTVFASDSVWNWSRGAANGNDGGEDVVNNKPLLGGQPLNGDESERFLPLFESSSEELQFPMEQ